MEGIQAGFSSSPSSSRIRYRWWCRYLFLRPQCWLITLSVYSHFLLVNLCLCTEFAADYSLQPPVCFLTDVTFLGFHLYTVYTETFVATHLRFEFAAWEKKQSRIWMQSNCLVLSFHYWKLVWMACALAGISRCRRIAVKRRERAG